MTWQSPEWGRRASEHTASPRRGPPLLTVLPLLVEEMGVLLLREVSCGDPHQPFHSSFLAPPHHKIVHKPNSVPLKRAGFISVLPIIVSSGVLVNV